LIEVKLEFFSVLNDLLKNIEDIVKECLRWYRI
jgi:hypothetical protein